MSHLAYQNSTEPIATRVAGDLDEDVQGRRPAVRQRPARPRRAQRRHDLPGDPQPAGAVPVRAEQPVGAAHRHRQCGDHAGQRGVHAGFEHRQPKQQTHEQVGPGTEDARLVQADKAGKPMPRQAMPQIDLKSPKITRKLTTEWFARRVEGRYKTCLGRGVNCPPRGTT